MEMLDLQLPTGSKTGPKVVGVYIWVLSSKMKVVFTAVSEDNL